MEDIIWTIENQPDEITLCGKSKYEVIISVGLKKSKDYSILLEFINVHKDYSELLALSQAQHDLEFYSKLLSTEGYSIANIVILRRTFGQQIFWECASDDPTPLSNPPIK